MAFFMLLGAGVFFLMTTFFTEVRQTIVPRGEVKPGMTRVLSRTDPAWVRPS